MRTPTGTTLSRFKSVVLTPLKRGFMDALYDAHPVAAWVGLAVVVGVMTWALIVWIPA